MKLAANGDKCSNVAKKLTLSLLSAELQSTGNEVIGPQDPDRKKKSTLDCDQTLYVDTRQSVTKKAKI